MIATIAIGWPVLSILAAAIFSTIRGIQKKRDRAEMELALAAHLPCIETTYRREG